MGTRRCAHGDWRGLWHASVSDIAQRASLVVSVMSIMAAVGVACPRVKPDERSDRHWGAVNGDSYRRSGSREPSRVLRVENDIGPPFDFSSFPLVAPAPTVRWALGQSRCTGTGLLAAPESSGRASRTCATVYWTALRQPYSGARLRFLLLVLRVCSWREWPGRPGSG